MRETDKIREKTGGKNPFNVPEGYFEHFPTELLNRLPEKEPVISARRSPTLWEKVRPWVYMAAMFVGAALIIRVVSTDRVPAASENQTAEETEMEYINVAMDNSMMDDYSLYVYLAEED